MKAKKDDEDASRAADPALEQGERPEKTPRRNRAPEPEEDEDQVEEASGDSFPTSDAPSW